MKEILSPLLDYLTTVTTWLYDESKNVELVSEQRAAFEAAGLRETATDLERVQNHITFINEFIGKSFVEKHGYFSQRLTQHLKDFNAYMKLYVKLAKNEREKKNGANIYYGYGSDLDSNCQLNPYNVNTDAEGILSWLAANWIPIIDTYDDETYAACGPFEFTHSQTIAVMQVFLGVIAAVGLMTIMIIRAMPIEEDNSSSGIANEYKWTDAKIALFVLWLFSFDFAATNHMFFHEKINDMFNHIDSYLTNRDVVALYKKSASSILFFEIINLLLHPYIAMLHLGVINGNNPVHWLSLLAYYPSVIAAQLTGRSFDAGARTIAHYASGCVATLKNTLFFRKRPNNDIENASLVAPNYGTINGDSAERQEKNHKKSCWSRFF